MIGAGGWGGVWIRQFLPRVQDRLRVAGLVDMNRQALDQAGDLLSVDPMQRFSTMPEAFARTEADFCILCIQPAYRKEAVSLAVERGLHILCEKPVAESWESCLDILRMAKDAGLKLAVVQNYRFNRPFLTIRQVLDEGRLGRINYIICRFAADYDVRSAGGAFRHQIPGAMLYEGSVHHFDQLRNLAGADCAWISGAAWNPAWSTFNNDSCALFVMEMTNGVMCVYETNNLAKGAQNGWHREHYRVECERGAISVDRDDVARLFEHSGQPDRGSLQVTELELVPAEYEGHYRIINDFLGWLDGGPAPPTSIDDNIRTAAMSFGAVEAARDRRVVDVSAKLADAGL